MSLSESEDELDELHSDLDSLDSDYSASSNDRDYIPSGLDEKDTDEDISEEEHSPTKRRRQCRSVYASPVSSPLKSPSMKGKQTPVRKKINFSSPTKKISSTSKTPSTPDDADLWRDIDEEDVEPVQPRFRPLRDVGPQLDRAEYYTPLELFKLFFSRKVIETLVRNSNSYGKKIYKNQDAWKPVTAADMYSFLCLVLYMGLVPLKTLREFWRGSELLSLPFPASVMACRRFLEISRILHMNDPAVEADNDQKKGTPEYDTFCKIKPLYEQIVEACHTFFQPKQHIAIDERMVASKARIRIKQYIKNKPTKWGFKLFVLADSACGYTLNFFVYGGKEGESSGKGLGYDSVMRLLNIPHLGKGHKLYVDSYYTSPTLFLDLLRERKIWACGTLRSNATGYFKKKSINLPEKAPRGTIRWLRKGELLFVRWFDTRPVTLISTMHKAYSNDTAKRKVKNADGQWTEKEVPIPECVRDYNHHMGGVDLSNALIGYYNVIHKTRKWYKTLFYHFVDIATVNAFILHKELCKLQGRTPLTQKTFREQLILSLAEIGSSRNMPATQTVMATHPPSVELKKAAHLPTYFVEHMIDVRSGSRATVGRRRCIQCKRKSPVYCSICHKTLCFNAQRNCYSEWHKQNKICA